MGTNISVPILVLNIREIDVYNRIIYIIDLAYKNRFTLLVNIFIYQLSNFYILQTQKLDVI